MSRMKKNPNAEWFVEPNDSFANEIIMNYLNQLGEGSADIEQVKIADTQGQLHNVLQVNYKTLRDLVKYREQKPEFKFNIWSRTRYRAPLHDCSYIFTRKSVRQSAEVKRVERQLAKIKKPANPDDCEPF